MKKMEALVYVLSDVDQCCGAVIYNNDCLLDNNDCLLVADFCQGFSTHAEWPPRQAIG